jgi:hypothetical protein
MKQLTKYVKEIMGKKKNKKFKQIKTSPSVELTTSLQTVDEDTIAEPTVTESKDYAHELDDRYQYVRKDITKLMITIGALAGLMVVFTILREKTEILTTIGDWIYKAGNFQI